MPSLSAKHDSRCLTIDSDSERNHSVRSEIEIEQRNDRSERPEGLDRSIGARSPWEIVSPPVRSSTKHGV